MNSSENETEIISTLYLQPRNAEIFLGSFIAATGDIGKNNLFKLFSICPFDN